MQYLVSPVIVFKHNIKAIGKHVNYRLLNFDIFRKHMSIHFTIYVHKAVTNKRVVDF